MEHECIKAAEIAVLENNTCTMKSEIERCREHIDGSADRQKTNMEKFAAIEKKIDGQKIWLLMLIVIALGNVILTKVWK